MKKTNEFPSGWNEQRIREVLEHYENQTDEEAAAEHEAALSSPEHTVMEMPAELRPEYKRSDFGELVRGKYVKGLKRGPNVVVRDRKGGQ